MRDVILTEKNELYVLTITSTHFQSLSHIPSPINVLHLCLEMQLYDQLMVLEKQTIVAGNINGVLEETLRAVGNEAQEVCDLV